MPPYPLPDAYESPGTLWEGAPSMHPGTPPETHANASPGTPIVGAWMVDTRTGPLNLKGIAVAAKGSDGRGRMRKRNGGGGKGRVHEGNGGSERSCMHERGPDMQERQKGAGARVEWTCLRPREVS